MPVDLVGPVDAGVRVLTDVRSLQAGARPEAPPPPPAPFPPVWPALSTSPGGSVQTSGCSVVDLADEVARERGRFLP
ncbi:MULTISPECIES: hypothetical protein [Thermomonosporaceae]|uniref:hypothetical protein n=1 Tax=Thermomonosporaceae TaxID=2012 RepID=UPI00255B2951|nr:MULTISPECIES: hypothetical protein [Thermomonosporaceae]MDL4773256.1 hypothetical protein [Actinomadura xylanilytica]